MKRYDILKLENQLCFSLYAASKELIRLYKPFLEKHNLTYTQYVTMLVIWEKNRLSIKELGETLHLDSGTLTPLVKKLETMDLIKKYRSKDDDRVVIVELLEKGLKLKEDILEVPESMLCKFSRKKDSLILLKDLLDDLLLDISNKTQ